MAAANEASGSLLAGAHPGALYCAIIGTWGEEGSREMYDDVDAIDEGRGGAPHESNFSCACARRRWHRVRSIPEQALSRQPATRVYFFHFFSTPRPHWTPRRRRRCFSRSSGAIRRAAHLCPSCFSHGVLFEMSSPSPSEAARVRAHIHRNSSTISPSTLFLLFSD